MRSIGVGSLALLLLVGGTAAAQDPYPPPPPQPYPPQPYPPQPVQPQPYVPPPQHYQPQQPQPIQLTPDDHALLQQGEISDGAHVGGAVASLFFGFGLGQAVQGRYSESGWIFTLGEAASVALLVYGITEAFSCDSQFDDSISCNDNNNGGLMIATGFIGLMVFRVWEVVDAFSGPPKHNRRVRELKMRLGIPVPMYAEPKVRPYMNRTRDNGGTVGLQWRF